MVKIVTAGVNYFWNTPNKNELSFLQGDIENYEALLDLWKDADEEIPERSDTVKRLAALKQRN